MPYEVTFPGGLAIDATFGKHTIHTDQPLPDGGTDTAMSPSALLFASMATCMGFYALRFCQQRSIGTDGLGLTLTPVRDPESKRVTDVTVELRTPHEFPEKYRDAILRAIDHCSVKRTMLDPPRFEIRVS